MNRSEGSDIRVLFAVSGGPYEICLAASIAASMPEAKFLFLGTNWSQAFYLKTMGLRCSTMPWRFSLSAPTILPPILDVRWKGYSHDFVPLLIRRAFGTLTDFVRREVERFHPTVVLYVAPEHALAYSIIDIAEAKGIPAIGIQKIFMKDHVFVHNLGRSWQSHIQSQHIPLADYTNMPKATTLAQFWRNSAEDARRMKRLQGSCYTWLNRLERFFRVATGSVSFDTVHGLCAMSKEKILQAVLGNMSNLGAPVIRDDIPNGHVLVALHRPVLASTYPTWIDLLSFSLAATPDDVPIIIRPHPDERKLPLPPSLEKALRTRGVRISRPGKGATLEELLRQSSAMFTLTSAAGMQALAAGVPTFTLGPAFYARPGLARQVTLLDAPLVRDALKQPDNFRPNPDDVQKFVDWLCRAYMTPAPACAPHVIPAHAIAQRIHGIVAATKINPSILR